MKDSKFMKSDRLSMFLEILIIISMIAIPAIMVIFPFVSKEMIEYMGRKEVYDSAGNYKMLLICLYPSMISGFFILNCARQIFRVVRKGTPFCDKVPKCLNAMCILVLIIALFTMAKMIAVPGIITAAIIAVCVIAALCFFVLAEVFEKAIEIKNENDLTI